MQEAWRFLLFGLAISAFLSINLVIDTIPELAWAQQEKTIRLEPTDDAFIAVDLNDPQDEQGLQQLHTGDLEFLKLWYAWNVTENQERITTGVYLKFDLTEVDPEEVESAELNMQPFIVRLTTAVFEGVEIVKIPSNDWNEMAITYQNRPLYPTNAATSSLVITANNWFSWDLTEYVKESAGSELSVAMGFENIYQNTEELLTFYSKESANKTNVPYLEIALAQPVIAQQKIDQTTFSDSDEYLPIIGLVAAIVGGGAAVAFLMFRKRTGTVSRPSGKPPTVQTGTKAKCFSCGKIIPRGLFACPLCGKNPRKPKS